MKLYRHDLHLIAYHYSTHNHPKAQRWLEGHPLYRMQFIPTRGVIFRMGSRFFRELTDNNMKH